MHPGGNTINVVLISPYELGRQPFGLAEPAAMLEAAGCRVICLDLSLQALDARALAEADLVGLYLAMHTATRIAVEALPRIQELAPRSHLVAYGLYAPVNSELLRKLGVSDVLGGECEPALLELATRLQRGEAPPVTTGAQVNLGKVDFVTPQRAGLPSITRYAHLKMPDGGTRTVGFAEGSRGCKHLCRHCPVVPVYHGRFRVVPVDVVIADVAQQVALGAEHISFGDPDFFNGPTHALRIVTAMHERFPTLTYDATIKVEHLLDKSEHLPTLARTGCLFITSAVESVDANILEYLDKGHTREDFARAVELLREAGIAMAPTFVPFTPWTTLEGYLELLEHLVRLRLVAAVPAIQLAIRLLVPSGSYLLKLEGFRQRLDDFDPATLGYPWRHRDPRVDALQRSIQAVAERSEAEDWSRRATFERIWTLTHEALARDVPPLPSQLGDTPPGHSEPWYCCAEPTANQLKSVAVAGV